MSTSGWFPSGYFCEEYWSEYFPSGWEPGESRSPSVAVSAAVAPAFVVASFHRQTGLSILVREPVATRRNDNWSLRLTDQIDSYSHDIRAVGGYWSARIGLSDDLDVLEDWIEDGLGRDILVHDEALDIVWEGFVNKISLSAGELAYEIGPLLDIGNRVKVVYSSIDNSVEPPILGTRTATAQADDSASQARYGIIEKILSSGGSTATQAEQNRDTWLAENAWPAVSIDLNLGQGSGQSMTLDCLGYWHMLGAYTYANTGVTGEENLSTKVTNILGGDPNGIFSTDYSRVASNTLQVEKYENDDKTGLELLKGLNALGDSSDRRYVMGVYAGRRVLYTQVTDEVEYLKRITANSDFTDTLQGIVQPWNVQPGKWVFVPDFLVGRLPPVSRDSLNRDPRTGLIEVSSLRAPRGVRVSGGKVSQLDQALAKQGLAGVGA